MEYRRFNNTIVARLDRGEELVTQLKQIAAQENITLAEISALGATDDFTVGLLDTRLKDYRTNQFRGDFEIISLTGTITTMNGEFYSHLHLSAGDETGRMYGGHLNRAVISVTCEMIIRLIDGRVERKFEPSIGVNLLDFAD